MEIKTAVKELTGRIIDARKKVYQNGMHVNLYFDNGDKTIYAAAEQPNQTERTFLLCKIPAKGNAKDFAKIILHTLCKESEFNDTTSWRVSRALEGDGDIPAAATGSKGEQIKTPKKLERCHEHISKVNSSYDPVKRVASLAKGREAKRTLHG